VLAATHRFDRHLHLLDLELGGCPTTLRIPQSVARLGTDRHNGRSWVAW
jgi:hypothetical protein